MLEVYRIKLFFMLSSGGLIDAHAFHGKDAILGGPIGGIVRKARITELAFAGASIGSRNPLREAIEDIHRDLRSEIGTRGDATSYAKSSR